MDTKNWWVTAGNIVLIYRYGYISFQHNMKSIYAAMLFDVDIQQPTLFLSLLAKVASKTVQTVHYCYLLFIIWYVRISLEKFNLFLKPKVSHDMMKVDTKNHIM